MNDPTYERAAFLLEANLQDELVALDPEAGSCFGFNEVAKTVWQLLSSPRTVTQIRQALLDRYEVTSEQCANELDELLAELCAQGLVRKSAR